MRGLQNTMPAEVFANHGRQTFVYVKRTVIDGREFFAVHAADGQHLVHFANRDTANVELRRHDLEMLSVH
jgi:hypothetical protein